MDFFAAQELARRRSRLFAILFGLAVVGVVLVVYLPVHVLYAGGRLDPLLFAYVAVPVTAVILGSSWWRLRGLRAGGPRVATLLGGRPVPPNTTDPAERRLVNIVEEMALASGTPVPAVFVLDGEESINAFAAGYSIHDAAVAVTRGCLQRLDRDELQGVIAHEFSHILNGDMRLNIRMIGLLFGLLVLTVVGRGVLRSTAFRSSRRSDAAAGALAVGLLLVVVGYIGIFFGKVIKSAISRQREYLADAAAVQFTRNPAGIAGALKKIATLLPGSVVRDHHAEELSHLFFASGLRDRFFTVFRTHPPLEDRIRRVDPGWDGSYDVAVPEPMKEEIRAARAERVAGEGVPAMARLGLPAAAVLASLGAPAAAHLAYARDLLDRIPDSLRDAAHDPTGARALVLALLLAPRPGPVRTRQLRDVAAYGGPELTARADALAAPIAEAGADARLALLDLALPSLRDLAEDDAAHFRRTAQRLIQADDEVEMFEYALVHILARHLPPGRDRAAGIVEEIHSFRPVRDEVAVVLGALARSGAESDRDAEAAFRAAVERLPDAAHDLALPPAAALDLAAVDAALRKLERTALGVRRRLVDALAHCVAFDGRILPGEAEGLRAVAEALDCPLPPVADGVAQRVVA
jgi:Zn-dependent protease with chaperone function